MGGSDFSFWRNENSFNFTSSDRFIFKFFNFRCRSREGWWPGLTKLSFCILGARGDIREHIGNGLDTRSPGLKNTHNVKTWALPTSSLVKIQNQLTETERKENQLGRHGSGQCSQTVHNFDDATGSSHVDSVSKFYFCLMFYGGTWHDQGCHSSMSWQNILSLPQITVFKHGPMTKLDISCFNSPYLWC